MTNSPMVYALDRATVLMDKLAAIRDAVGELDDYYETEFIDNNLVAELGAYQHITYALSQLRMYAWQLEEEIGKHD